MPCAAGSRRCARRGVSFLRLRRAGRPLDFKSTGHVTLANGAGSKRFEAMRANPRAWRIADLEQGARWAGANVRRTTGSHVVFEHARSPLGLSVSARRPIKPVYVRKFVAWIDSIRGRGSTP